MNDRRHRSSLGRRGSWVCEDAWRADECLFAVFFSVIVQYRNQALSYLDINSFQERHNYSQPTMIASKLVILLTTLLGVLTTLVLFPGSDNRQNQRTLFLVSDPKTVRLKIEHKPATIVTAFFQIPNKHGQEWLLEMVENFLSLSDFVIVFTSQEFVERFSRKRHNLKLENRTFIVPMELRDTPIASLYPSEFWEAQLEMDHQRDLHKGYFLFWIWLSKTWFISQAIKLNPFSHEIFIWSDMGGFRDGKYNHQLFARHTEIIPRNVTLLSSMVDREMTEKYARSTMRQTNGFGIRRCIECGLTRGPSSSPLFTVGSFIAGYSEVLQRYHRAFVRTIKIYNENGWYIGEDQYLLQTTCLTNRELCQYLSYKKSRKKVGWYHFADALAMGPRHNGVIYQYWYPSKRATVKPPNIPSLPGEKRAYFNMTWQESLFL
jgi:hypothetical protein